MSDENGLDYNCLKQFGCQSDCNCQILQPYSDKLCISLIEDILLTYWIYPIKNLCRIQNHSNCPLILNLQMLLSSHPCLSPPLDIFSQLVGFYTMLAAHCLSCVVSQVVMHRPSHCRHLYLRSRDYKPKAEVASTSSTRWPRSQPMLWPSASEELRMIIKSRESREENHGRFSAFVICFQMFYSNTLFIYRFKKQS